MKLVFEGLSNPIARGYNKFIFLIISDPLKIAQLWRQRGVAIGENTYIYRNVKFGRGGKDPITIGSNCVLTGCTILGHDASTNKRLGIHPGENSQIMPVRIEDNCFIGVGAIILMGVTIGKDSIVGAGAVVTADIPPGSVAAGNPAQVIEAVEDLVQKRVRLASEHPEFFPSHPRILNQE